MVYEFIAALLDKINVEMVMGVLLGERSLSLSACCIVLFKTMHVHGRNWNKWNLSSSFHILGLPSLILGESGDWLYHYWSRTN